MKLEIKEPCHEDWNKMKIGMISRHCASCDKSVMDFTKMHRAEIITYILSNPSDNVCGRMTRDQFDFHHEDIPVLIETLRKTKNPNPFLIMALVCLSLSACAQDTPPVDTIPVIEYTLGEIPVPIPVDDSLKTQNKPIDNVLIKGKVACEPIIDQGEVEPVMVGDIAPVVQGGIGFYDPEEEPKPETEKVFQFAEQMPEFKGGMDAMFKHIQSQLNYPKYEKEKGIQGNVYVRFVVDKEGRITKPEILKSVEGSKNFDKEVLRIINTMPRWNPGENDGAKVPVYMTLPFQFKIK